MSVVYVRCDAISGQVLDECEDLVTLLKLSIAETEEETENVFDIRIQDTDSVDGTSEGRIFPPVAFALVYEGYVYCVDELAGRIVDPEGWLVQRKELPTS